MSIHTKDSFIFYRSFFETLQDLPRNQRLDLYEAISFYALNDEKIDLKGMSKTIFKLIEPQLQANRKRYENGKKGAEHGKKGGRPKKEKTPKKPLDNPEAVSEKTPNKNNNVNKNNNKELAEQFEFIYRLYNQGKALKVIPFDRLKTRFQNCLKEVTFEELTESVTDYLTYLSTSTWRKKKAFDAWISSSEFYANDWKGEDVNNNIIKESQFSAYQHLRG